MHILLNGKDQDIPEAATVAALLTQLGYDPKAIAVAVNREFVPRSAYAAISLTEHDDVEIVAPMQGG